MVRVWLRFEVGAVGCGVFVNWFWGLFDLSFDNGCCDVCKGRFNIDGLYCFRKSILCARCFREASG